MSAFKIGLRHKQGQKKPLTWVKLIISELKITALNDQGFEQKINADVLNTLNLTSFSLTVCDFAHQNIEKTCIFVAENLFLFPLLKFLIQCLFFFQNLFLGACSSATKLQLMFNTWRRFSTLFLNLNFQLNFIYFFGISSLLRWKICYQHC